MSNRKNYFTSELQGIIDELPCAFAAFEVIKNASNEAVDFKCTYFNKTALIDFNLPENKIPGKTLKELFPDSTEMLAEGIRVMEDGAQRKVRFKADNSLVASMAKLNDDLTISWKIETSQVEEKLLEKATEMEAILSCIRSGIFVYDKEGRIIRTNPSAHEVLNYDSKELDSTMEERLSHTVVWDEQGRRVMPDDMPAKRAVIYGETAKGLVFRVLVKDEEKWITVSAAPLFILGKHTGAVVSMIDITARRKAQEELKKSQEILNLILDYVNEGIIVSEAPEGKVIALSKWGLNTTIGGSIAALTNLEKYLIAWDVRDVNTKEKIKPEDLPVARALRGETIHGHEWILARSDGSNINILVNAVPIFNEEKTQVVHAISTWMDITERRKTEEALKESEERFRTLADHISQLAWISDKKGKPSWFNKRWYEFTGIPGDEIKKEGTKQFHHPDYYEKVITKFYDSVSRGEPWEDIYPMKSRDGIYKWILGRAMPIYDDNGDIVRWFGTGTDITEQKKLQDDLQSALKEREVLLRELHHRTKNNMQIISSLISIKSSMTATSEISDIFQEMQNRIRSIALVHEKLYRSENLSKIHLGDYIKDLVELLIYSSSTGAKKIEFKYEMEEVNVTIDNAIPCGLIITELVLNTIKHAFPGDKTGFIDITLKQLEDESIQLQICDNGVGLVRTEDANDNTKLGLQLFREIVENQLHGTIEMKNTNGLTWIIKFKNTQ